MDPNIRKDDELYFYADGDVMRNKFGIRDKAELETAERRWTQFRAEMGVPDGNFDLDHLKAIHRHLFQDVYHWAGETRETFISKNDDVFMNPKHFDLVMADVQNRLKDRGYLVGVDREEFASQAGIIIGDINRMHPFREGNGRTQLQFLKKLGEHAGFDVAIERINPDDWIKASRDSFEADYTAMQDCILGVTSERSQERSKSQDRERDR